MKTNLSKYLTPDRATGVLLVAVVAWYTTTLDGGLWLDEVLYARAGYSTLTGNPFVNPTHMFAPLGKYAVGAGQLLFSPSPFAARIGVVAVGVFLFGSIHRMAKILDEPWAGPLTVGALAIFPPVATHTTSAMLDTTLAAAVFLLFIVSYRQWQFAVGERTPAADGHNHRLGGAALGVAAVLVCASKAYGLLYAVGPTVGILWFRRRRLGTVRAVTAPALGALVTFFVVFAPHMLVSPPDYYAGASIPPLIEAVMQTPVVGGIAYAFGASLVHNLTAHGSSAGVELSTLIQWIVSTGPWPVAGLLLVLTCRWLPNRLRLDPWWLPTLVVGPPLVALLVFIPKGFLRYTLPMFPVFALLVVIVGLRTAKTMPKFRATTIVVLGLVLTTPAVPFLAGAQLSADSQFEEVVSVTTDSEVENLVVVSQRSIVMWWHLGDHYVESYSFDPTKPTVFGDQNGPRMTVIGIDENREPSIQRAESAFYNGTVTHAVLLKGTSQVGSVDVSACGTVTKEWSRYETGQRDTVTLSLWNVSDCGSTRSFTRRLSR